MVPAVSGVYQKKSFRRTGGPNFPDAGPRGLLMVGRGFINSYLSPKRYRAFSEGNTPIDRTRSPCGPTAVSSAVQYIICPLPYPDVTGHLPRDPVIFG
jgi:hypothetical protein